MNVVCQKYATSTIQQNFYLVPFAYEPSIITLEVREENIHTTPKRGWNMMSNVTFWHIYYRPKDEGPMVLRIGCVQIMEKVKGLD